MATFRVNSSRRDPYKNFKFRVKWDGRYVAGVAEVSGLKSTSEAVKHRKAPSQSSARKIPGLKKSGAVTLKRGVTHDRKFEAWATSAWADAAGSAGEGLQKNARRNVNIDVYNEAGKISLSYKLHKCWVSEIQAVADLDANANGVAIESIKLENEGWELQKATRL